MPPVSKKRNILYGICIVSLKLVCLEYLDKVWILLFILSMNMEVHLQFSINSTRLDRASFFAIVKEEGKYLVKFFPLQAMQLKIFDMIRFMQGT